MLSTAVTAKQLYCSDVAANGVVIENFECPRTFVMPHWQMKIRL